MKKIVYILVSLLFVLTLSVSASHVYADDDIDVEGHVKDNGVNVAGALVTATCTFKGVTRTKHETTDSHGEFEDDIEFDQKKHCDVGAVINVTATKGNKSAHLTFTVIPGKDDYVITLNLISPSAVPEFGMLTGIGALITSAGAFITLKKRS